MKSNINEIDLAQGREFYTMQSLVNDIAPTIIVGSWGASGWTQWNESTLKFTVRGRLHKGFVFIHLNFMDTFTVYLTDRSGEIVQMLDNVYIDELLTRLDEAIDTPVRLEPVPKEIIQNSQRSA